MMMMMMMMMMMKGSFELAISAFKIVRSRNAYENLTHLSSLLHKSSVL